MAKIKTREVDRASIKTMNRTASASHRIRNAGAEIRQISRRQMDVQEQSASEYSTARVEESMQKAAWKAERAAEVGVVKTSKYAKAKLQERRARNAKVQHVERPYGYTDEHSIVSAKGGTITRYERRPVNRPSAEKMQSVRTKPNEKWNRESVGIKGRKAMKNKSDGTAGHISKAGTRLTYAELQQAMRNVSKTSYHTAKSGAGIVKQLADSFTNTVKITFGGAKALILAAVGGSTVAVMIIVVCCFLGCVMYLSDESESGGYTPMIVTVAETQIGNEGGEPFWRWYGFEERVDWCAIFVSWCSEQCGYLDAEILPKFAVVGDGAEWFKAKRQWKSGRYTPKAGDIIFFDWEEDGVMDHVGIVEKCENRTVYTIEGNAGDVCQKLQYALRSEKICGYGVPVYNSLLEMEQNGGFEVQGGE